MKPVLHMEPTGGRYAIVVEDIEIYHREIGARLWNLGFEVDCFATFPSPGQFSKTGPYPALLITDLYNSREGAGLSRALCEDVPLVKRRMEALQKFKHLYPSAVVIVFSFLKNLILRCEDPRDSDALAEVLDGLRLIGIPDEDIVPRFDSNGSTTGALSQLREVVNRHFSAAPV